MTIQLDPITPDFDQFDFSQLIDMELPEGTQVTYSYSNGSITADLNYFENLQDSWCTITLNLSQVNSWYFKLAPQAVTDFQMAPTNNLASNIYSQAIYDQKSML